ncbi:MAG: UbiA prenyltransferase family protein [Thermoanaerobaculia bacterium]
MAALADFVELARPRHWVKGVFILMPVPFSIAAGAQLRLTPLVLGLIGFSLVTSAVYVFNDLLDARLDRHHPDKKDRPLAAGRIGRGLAALFSGVLLATGLGLLALTGIAAAAWIAGVYVGLNLFYSVRGKRIPLVDVFLLASGFVLRVLLGCALVAVQASNWLLLCSSTLALFLALGKRRADLVAGLDDQHRPSHAGYNRACVEQAIGITAGVALVSYALYCIEAEVLVPGREFASLPFVAFGILEYVRLVHTREAGGSPVDLALSSPSMLIVGVGWLVAVLWSTGFL